MKTTKEIQATTINRVSDKSGKFLGYLVKSNSSDNYYQVTWNESATRYECNCVATCKCCHIKAVEQVQATRAELRPRYNAIVASKQQEITSPVQAENENEVVSVKVGNVTVCSSRKHIANAVAHTKWSQEMAAYARSKDAERARTRTASPDEVAAVEGGKVETRYFEQKRALDEQYSKAPSAWELSETQASEMRAFYNGL